MRFIRKLLGLQIKKNHVIRYNDIYMCLQKGASTSCNKHGVKVSQHIIFGQQQLEIMNYLRTGKTPIK